MTKASTFFKATILAAICGVPAHVYAGCMSGDGSNTTVNQSSLGSASCKAQAGGGYSVAVGFQANSSGSYSVAIGEEAWADGTRGIAVGEAARASAAGHIAIGNLAGSRPVGAKYGISIGTSSQAYGSDSIAIGGALDWQDAALANGYRSIAVGRQSSTFDFGTAVGFNTKAEFAATALGTDSSASERSVALGRFSNASNVSAVAIGEGAVVNQPRSVAIGAESLANQPDVLSVGSKALKRRIIFVAPGTGQSDAVNLAQAQQIAKAAALSAMSERDEARDTGIAELRRTLAELRSLIELQHRRIAELERRQTASMPD